MSRAIRYEPGLVGTDNSAVANATVERAELLDICYDCITLPEVMERVRAACGGAGLLRIATVNMNFATLARSDRRFAAAIGSSGLSVMDGQVLLWITWLLGAPAPERITGHDLLRECARLAQEKRYRIFLLGAEENAAAELAERLEREFPGLRAFGTHHGRFSRDGIAENQEALSRQIREFRPEFLFVALGAPKQEVWLANHQAALGVPVGVGVGSVFDVWTARLPRAPRWMQEAGLESVFQLFIAPERYLKRYLVDDIPTLARAISFAVRHRVATRQ